MNDLMEKLEKLSIDEEKKKLMREVLIKLFNEGGIMTLTGKSVKPSIKAGERLFFRATLIGYDKEALRKKFVKFKEGVLEEASFVGRPLLSFHKHDRIPIGKIVEDWMENGEKKIIAWTDDEETQLAIKTGKLMELSAGFLPDVDLEEDEEDGWVFAINKVDPAEASVVVFPAYAKAEIEEFWSDESEEEAEDEEKLTTEKEIKEIPEEKLEEVIPQENEDELNKLSVEKELLETEVRKLERDKILLKYTLSDEDKELIMELDKKYNLNIEDFEAIVEKQEEPPEKKGEKLPVSQRDEMKSDKEKALDAAEKMAEDYLKRKGYK